MHTSSEDRFDNVCKEYWWVERDSQERNSWCEHILKWVNKIAKDYAKDDRGETDWNHPTA